MPDDTGSSSQCRSPHDLVGLKKELEKAAGVETGVSSKIGGKKQKWMVYFMKTLYKNE